MADTSATLLESARQYHALGWALVVLKPGQKRPASSEWQRTRLSADDVARVFAGDANVGVQTGSVSGGLVDVDLDTPEAVAAGRLLLPKTPAVFGRPSRPQSHYLYLLTDPATSPRIVTFNDPTVKSRRDALVLELRGDGHQTLLPGSLHPDGERVAWARGCGPDPAPIELEALRTAVNATAAAALLARHWPGEGLRHDAALALAGLLQHGGYGREAATRLIEAVAVAAGDNEPRDRVRGVQGTWDKAERGERTRGGTALSEWIDPKVIAAVRGWLGLATLRPPEARFRLTTAATVVPAPPALNGNGHHPAPAGGIVRDTAADARAAEEAVNAHLAELPLNDRGNAARLVALCGERLRYCAPWRTWLVWDGRHWTRDEAEGARTLAIQTVDQLRFTAAWAAQQAAQADTNAERNEWSEKAEALQKWSRASGQDARVSGLLSLARGLRDDADPRRSIPIHPDHLNRDPWLLNVENGTLDLRTDALRPHDPLDYLTHVAPVTYDPGATAPRWEAFLADILPDPDVRAFVQRLAGYALTGVVTDHVLPIFWGSGSNGKSTLITTLLDTFGKTLADQAAPDLLVAKPNETRHADTADLFGKRLVASIETDQMRRLNEALVKQLTGGDRVKTKRLYENLWSYQPTHKLLLVTNHRPLIKGTDEGIWRRVVLVPFTVRIPDERKDVTLPAQLAAERSGILNWALDGLRAWRAQGQRLLPPATVVEATRGYRSDSDTLGAFIAERCEVHPAAHVTVACLYDAYTRWAEALKERPERRAQFSERMRERGFIPERYGRSRHWTYFGITLREDADSDGGATPDHDPSSLSPSFRLSRQPDGGTSQQAGEGDRGEANMANVGERESEQTPPFHSSWGTFPDSTFALVRHVRLKGKTEESEETEDAPTPAYRSTRPNDLPDWIEWLDTTAAVRAAADSLSGLSSVGLDLETVGLDPHSPEGRIRLVQFGTCSPDGSAPRAWLLDCDAVSEWPTLVRTLFQPVDGLPAPRVVGHNLTFDLEWLAVRAGLVVDSGERLRDTMLLSMLLSAGTPDGALRRNGLAACVERYLGETLSKEEQAGGWDAALLTREQAEYAARDTQAALRLWHHLDPLIEAADLGPTALLEMRCLPAVVWLHTTGAPFDRAAWRALHAATVAERDGVAANLTVLTGTTDLFGDATVNWDSHAQVRRILQQRGHRVTATDDDALVALAADDQELIPLLRRHRELSKRASSYGPDWDRTPSDPTADGRVHARYLQLGSRAGRFACERPNVQQVPRIGAYRACFRPAPGRAFVKADFSQIELRIAAEHAPDEAMLDVFRRGEDIHTVTAAAVLGKPVPEVTKSDRQIAKSVNFGLLYGAGASTLRAYAAANYGVTLTADEAARLRDAWFAAYPGIRAWHRRAGESEGAIDTRTLGGRRRRGVDRYTEKLNSPVQGTGADGLKLALALLWEGRASAPSAAPVLCVHDEIVLECDVADAPLVARWLEQTMRNGMRAFLKRVPVEVEASVFADWSGTPLPTPTGEETRE